MYTGGPDRVSTGVPDLDEVLHGGFYRGRPYLVRGTAGAGKTILGFHFLAAGAADGEDVAFVSLEERAADLRRNAASLGLDLGDVTVVDLSPGPEQFDAAEPYDVFPPDEADPERITDRLREALAGETYDRLFLDPLSELRALFPGDYQFRREVASLVTSLKERETTALFATELVTGDRDDLQFVADGALLLARNQTSRTVEVTKFRGSDFHGGRHTLTIDGEGLHVFPQLVPADHRRTFTTEAISSGVDELDALLGGGIERGTVTLVVGPTGVGKSTTGAHFVSEAARRGERSAVFLFEESRENFRYRSESVGVPVGELVESDALLVEEVEPLTLTTDEFAARVREEVEERDARVVMIDGTAGYRLALRGDEPAELTRELHALCRYLKNMGVTVLLTEETEHVTGDFRPTTANISYLADTILFLRYVEVQGEIHKTVGVLKKRLSDFERSLRELHITGDGLQVGDPLTDLRGVLTGTPEWSDGSDD